MAVILFFAARLSKRDTEKKKKWSRRTLTGRTLERLDRIGFLELVPYGAILMVIAPADADGAPHVGHHPECWRAGAVGPLCRRDQAWAGSPRGGALVAGAMWFIITQTHYMTARINLWLDPWAQRQGDGFQTVQSLLRHRLRRPAGPGAGQEPTEIPLPPRAGKRLHLPHRVRKSWDSSGRWWCCSSSPCWSCGGTGWPLHARDRFGALTGGGHHHPDWRYRFS